MELLCDQMLTRLGRWLRAAGYDTAIIEQSLTDRHIFEIAKQERCLLLTRDHHFLEIDPQQHLVVWLQANDLKALAQELSQKLNINWLKKPFSRCLLCNTALIEAPTSALVLVPPAVLQYQQQFWFCPHCHKAYWNGSHAARMLKTLQDWQQSHF